jgi:pSer/pThr/pTyr-binding forkhead associated (FHA) protein
MTEQLLLLFQVLFLILLYLFIWRVMRSASNGLKIPDQTGPMLPAAPQRPPSGIDPTEAALVVLASDSLEPGSVIRAGGTIMIGRGLDNAVALPDDDFASTHHARIEIHRESARIVDLESRNGTFVNGERVVSSRQLQSNDVVRVGATELKLTR